LLQISSEGAVLEGGEECIDFRKRPALVVSQAPDGSGAVRELDLEPKRRKVDREFADLSLEEVRLT